MKLIGRLEAIYSRRDINGNTYWAMRFTDYATGRKVCGTVCGGESNIQAVAFGWSDPKEWERGIERTVQELPIREFNRVTKGWPHAGCHPDELRRYIRNGLAATV